MTRFHSLPARPALAIAVLGAALALSACIEGDDGDRGPQGPPGGDPPTSTDLEQGDDVPGIVLEIVGVSGGSAAGGRFRPGDTVTVAFTLEKADGSTWDVGELSSGRTLVAGPTFNYQRVIAEVSDVVANAVQRADGSYRYTFATPIPATYLAPYNDTASFGADDGELTGQALLDGTYTVGLYFTWNYTVDGVSHRDADNAVFDFVIGDSGSVESREVVKQENCDRCHEDLQAHGGMRRDVTLCLLCHTAGAEDRNNAAVAGGTPGASVDFEVMIHKIHAGARLPSVQGVTTDATGARVYGSGTAYELVGFGDSIHDYSEVVFPAWPHGLVATPRDFGYTALSTSSKAAEDAIRMGPSNCVVCHGDPDGSGPLTEPAQGDLHKTQPTSQACGACHDDVVWGAPYTANTQTMGAQADNANCTLCHAESGDPLAVYDAHLHPLLDPSFNAGLNVAITDVSEAGTNDGDGTLDPGEKIEITFTTTNDAGANVAASAIGSTMSVVVAGPASNYNILLNTSLATAKLTGSSPYTTNVPMPVLVEYLGTATGGADAFSSAYAPHWNVSSATTTVYQRTALGAGSSTLASATGLPQNWVDVGDATGFAHDDYVVIDDGVALKQEYMRVQTVSGNRLWFGSTASTAYPISLQRTHAVGATVKEVTLSTVASGNYTLTASTGAIAEAGAGFTTGQDVLASYTTDFVLPSVYPIAINGSPDLDETSGKWTGKSLADGTYSVGLWGAPTLTLNLWGETNSYRGTADAAMADFLVGSASSLEPYGLISSGNNCYNCHQELTFHGAGRRGFESCLICHGTAGSEDRAPYVAGNAPATTGVSVTFREMLHKIHMGEELTNASTYTVVGFGSSTYPNNYTAHTYGEVVFPTWPGGVAHCAKCHGDANTAWHEPAPRDHPTDQALPVLRWAIVCGACHDSTDAGAHMQVQTTPGGAESCGVCHGADAEWSVPRMHKSY